MKKVSVIVLNYKTKDLSLKCVESVKKSNFKNIEIIVLDNNSNDGIEKNIEKDRDVTFIQNNENLGYAGGNNIGIRYALNNKTDFIFILNPDTVIEKNVISRLCEAIEEEKAGIAGPKILFDDKKTIWYAGGILDLANVLGRHRGVDKIDQGQYDKVEETDFVTGAAIFIRREVFELIGLFDEKYFLYLEDGDFCFRAKRNGFKTIFVPGAVVYHKNAQITGLGSALQDYYISRNRLLFATKFLSWKVRFALFREALKNLNIPARRKALFDFITGNLWKGSIQ